MNKIIAFLHCILLATSSFCVTKEWIGVGDGINWKDPFNWVPSGVPGLTDDVRIDMDSIVISGGVIAQARSISIAGFGPSLTVAPNAELLIDGSSSGVYDDGIRLLDSTFFLNLGKITICNIVGSGIANSSSFRNEGILKIKHASRGIGNRHRFYNGISGVIEVDSCSSGLTSIVYFNNQGKFAIQYLSETVSLKDSVVNNGLFSVEHAEITSPLSEAISYDTGTLDNIFINDMKGQIVINDVVGRSLATREPLFNFGEIDISNVDGDAILNRSSFTNTGTITVSSASTGLRNLGTFTNHGNVTIDDIKSGSQGMGVEGTVVNEATGTFSFKGAPNSSSFGIIAIQPLTNLGNIIMESLQLGMSTTVDGFIGNLGEIVIKNSFFGIQARAGFQNIGGITISGCQLGIDIKDSSTFENDVFSATNLINCTRGLQIQDGGTLELQPESHFSILSSLVVPIEVFPNGILIGDGELNIE